MNELFNEIPILMKKELQNQLKVPRPSKTYAGQKKPVSGVGAYAPTPAIASGELYNTIDVFWRENQAGDPELIVEMADYWLWVNDGRRPGRFPPLAPIDRWQIQKGLSGLRDEKGKFISRKTITFLRARSIAKYGYAGNHFVDKALNQIKKQIEDKFGEAALKYVEDLLEKNIKLTNQGIEITASL